VDLAPVLVEVLLDQLVVCWYSVVPRLLLFPRFVVVLQIEHNEFHIPAW
jgi:hypothetical protein